MGIPVFPVLPGPAERPVPVVPAVHLERVATAVLPVRPVLLGFQGQAELVEPVGTAEPLGSAALAGIQARVEPRGLVVPQELLEQADILASVVFLVPLDAAVPQGLAERVAYPDSLAKVVFRGHPDLAGILAYPVRQERLVHPVSQGLQELQVRRARAGSLDLAV